MAYVDQNLGKEKTISFIATILIIAVVGYAFVTGLAYNVIKKAAKDLHVVDIQDQPPPPPEPPPPPPKDQPKPEVPPVVAPPPLVAPPVTQAPQVVTVPNPPPPVITPPAPPAPPAPPPKPSQATAGKPKGNFNELMSSDDYPPSALRDNEQGTTGFTLSYDASGKVTNCQITSSSGHPDLDDTACKLLTRRARFSPGKDTAGNAMGGSYSSRFTWQVPKE